MPDTYAAPDIHTMTIDERLGGWERWYCPTCGRLLHIRWEPEFVKIVLYPGDLLIWHSGMTVRTEE
jgi:hypothetical protein